MSKPSCDACSNLREYNANFIMNGVTDDIAASLANNTGLNPCLTDLHTDCEDLNDVNDCLIGHMDDDVDNYEVCDWKSLMHNFFPNLYETLKAMIASICGLWTKMATIEKKIDDSSDAVCQIASIINGNRIYVKSDITCTKFTEGDKGHGIFYLIFYKQVGVNSCGIKSNGIQSIRLMLAKDVSDGVYNRPFTCKDLAFGDVITTYKKAQLVPNYLTDDEYDVLTSLANYMMPVACIGTDANMQIMTAALQANDDGDIDVIVYSAPTNSGSLHTIYNVI